jgi:hypothetical protein
VTRETATAAAAAATTTTGGALIAHCVVAVQEAASKFYRHMIRM